MDVCCPGKDYVLGDQEFDLLLHRHMQVWSVMEEAWTNDTALSGSPHRDLHMLIVRANLVHVQYVSHKASVLK